MEEKKWRGKEERKREEIKEGRRERKERKQKGRRREAGSQRNFSPSSTHGIPTGWAYRCATGVRVKTFNNRLGPALTNGMETQQELGRVLGASELSGMNSSVVGPHGRATAGSCGGASLSHNIP